MIAEIASKLQEMSLYLTGFNLIETEIAQFEAREVFSSSEKKSKLFVKITQ